jgi:hypothetical protein
MRVKTIPSLAVRLDLPSGRWHERLRVAQVAPLVALALCAVACGSLGASPTESSTVAAATTTTVRTEIRPSPMGTPVPVGATATSSRTPQATSVCSPTPDVPTATPACGPGPRSASEPGRAQGLVFEADSALWMIQDLRRGTPQRLVGSDDLGGARGWFNLSSDGSKLAYTRSGTDLWMYDMLTRRSRPLVPDAVRAERADIRFAVWSSDGSWIVLSVGELHPPSAGGSLFTVQAETGQVTQVASGSAWAAFCWLPRSGRLAYVGEGSGRLGVWVVEPDGRGQRLLYESPSGEYLGLDWLDASPLDDTLLVEEGLTTQKWLAISPADGTWEDLRQQLRGDVPYLDVARWSPTGTKIGLQSGPKVYVLDVTSRIIRLVSSDLWHALEWSPDGSMIAGEHGRNCFCGVSAGDGQIVGCVYVEVSSQLWGWY